MEKTKFTEVQIAFISCKREDVWRGRGLAGWMSG